jgi:hypothetical protein
MQPPQQSLLVGLHVSIIHDIIRVCCLLLLMGTPVAIPCTYLAYGLSLFCLPTAS